MFLQLHIVRLQDDADMGFSVEEHSRNRFAVAAVRPDSPAARAGLAPGHVLMSLKLHPMGLWRGEEQIGSHRECQSWGAKSMADLDAHPAGRAVVVKVNSPEGFSAASDLRHQAVLRGKHLVRLTNSAFAQSIRPTWSDTGAKLLLLHSQIRIDQDHRDWERPGRFDAFLVDYDTQLQSGNEEPTVPATQFGRGSRGKRRAPGGHSKSRGSSKRLTLPRDGVRRNLGNRDVRKRTSRPPHLHLRC